MDDVRLAVEAARNALKSEDSGVVKSRLAALEDHLEHEEVFTVLGEALGCQSWSVRRLAANLLVEAGDATIPSLRQLLPVGNLDQVYWTCFVLARLGAGAGGLLVEAISSKNREHRLYAIHALTRRRHSDAVDSLVLALDDPVWSLRRRAADALAARTDSDLVIQALRAELTRGNRNKIYWGIRILSKLLGAKALPFLKKLGTWMDDDVRYVAVLTLARIGTPDAIPLLLDYLRDRSLVIREQVISALRTAGESAKEPLLKAMDTCSPEQRLTFLKALCSVAPGLFLERCRSLLQSSSAESKYTAIQALGCARVDEAFQILVGCFQDQLWVVRRFASDQLVTIGDPVVRLLYDAMQEGNEDTSYWAISTLGRIGGPAMAFLKEAVSTGERTTRGFAITALAETNNPLEAALMLRECFRDEHWPLRQQAAEVLKGLGQAAMPALVEPVCSQDENARFWSRKVLTAVLGEDAGRLFEGIASAPEPARSETILALEKLSPEELSRVVVLDPEQVLTTLGRPQTPTRSTPVIETPSTRFPSPTDDPLSYLACLAILLVESGGLEVYLRPGGAPLAKIEGSLTRLNLPVLSANDLDRFLATAHGATQAPQIHPTPQTALREPRAQSPDRTVRPPKSLSFELPGAGRVRMRIFHEARGPTLVLRPLGHGPPRLKDVGEDDLLGPLVQCRSGLILVSGLACSGRSWTAAALVDAVNRERAVHIATIESPVEHLHTPRQALVTQFEVPTDVPTMAEGLRTALDCDARVILLGDVPDRETANLVIDVASGNTLVIMTMRASGAVAAIRDLVDLTGRERRDRALRNLALSLRASIHQVLLPNAAGKGLVAVREFVSGVSNVTNALSQGRFSEIVGLLQHPPEGVRPFEQALRESTRRGLISQEVAEEAIKIRITADRGE